MHHNIISLHFVVVLKLKGRSSGRMMLGGVGWSVCPLTCGSLVPVFSTLCRLPSTCSIFSSVTLTMTMMFAVTSHRLLLIRQLANNAPNTTAKTRHRTISISRHCPDIFASGRHQSLGRCHVNYYPETETACSLVHLQAASFSSSSATEASEVQAAEEYSTTNTSLDDSIEEDAVSKDDATFVLPNNDNDNDVHVVMSNGSIASENSPPPLEILSEDIADTATAITSTTTDSNNDDKYQGIPPENVIRTGKVEWVE